MREEISVRSIKKAASEEAFGVSAAPTEISVDGTMKELDHVAAPSVE